MLFQAFTFVFSLTFPLALNAFLAVSPAIAHLSAYLPAPSGMHSGNVVAVVPEEDDAPDVSPSFLESFERVIRDELRASERYQQAAVGSIPSSVVPESSIEKALVNVFCTAHERDTIRTITGSGVFIDPQGVILTNAHIAQFLLLSEGEESTARCVIRQDSPAISKYEAELLYISPTWIKKNAHQLSSANPSGTGEHDFALLYVTSAFEGEAPETFPFLAPDPALDFFTTMDVHAAGYPAEALTSDNIHAPLVPAIATTTVSTLFTFGSKNVDLVTLAPSTVGRQGSSGGPIVDERDMVVGMIATRGNAEREGAQSLRALTIGYIDRTLSEETGLDLAHTVTGDVGLRAQVFRETLAPHLRDLLLAVP